MDIQAMGLRPGSDLMDLTPMQKRRGQESDLGGSIGRFAEELKKNRDPRGEQKLKDACVQMESILVKQMLTVMRKAVPKGGLTDGGQAEEIFTDMLYDNYAMKISESHSLGLAKTMYQQLSGGKWA